MGVPNIQQLLHPLCHHEYVHEVISPTIDHALPGTYGWAKLYEPYSHWYYHTTFDIYFIQDRLSNIQVMEDMLKAINTCRVLKDDEDHISIPPEFNDFPWEVTVQ